MYDIYQQSALGVKKCKVNIIFTDSWVMRDETYGMLSSHLSLSFVSIPSSL